MQATLPNLPSLVLSKIMQLREDLHCNTIAKYEGNKLTGDDFTSFVHSLHSKMPKVPFSALFNSVQHLAGMPITTDVSAELSWRLAGNLHYLRKGIIIPPFTRQLFPEWAAVQVWDVDRKKRPKWLGDKKDENKILDNKAELTLFVLTGLPAGRYLKQTWSESYFFNKETKTKLGFSSYDRRLYDRYFTGTNNYPFKDVRQLVKLRFFIYLDPTISKSGEACYKEMECSGAMRKWNRDLMKRRERHTFQCPKNYDIASVPCYKCEMGFNLCRAGCHSMTYIKKHCPKCDQEANFETPNAEWCVDCIAKTA